MASITQLIMKPEVTWFLHEIRVMTKNTIFAYIWLMTMRGYHVGHAMLRPQITISKHVYKKMNSIGIVTVNLLVFTISTEI